MWVVIFQRFVALMSNDMLLQIIFVLLYHMPTKSTQNLNKYIKP